MRRPVSFISRINKYLYEILLDYIGVKNKVGNRLNGFTIFFKYALLNYAQLHKQGSKQDRKKNQFSSDVQFFEQVIKNHEGFTHVRQK